VRQSTVTILQQRGVEWNVTEKAFALCIIKSFRIGK